VLVSTLGGLSAFGVHGLVLGPATAALFVALWHTGSVGRDPPEA
jgi:predicted PurR-regulated permease PerM